jgi:peptide/nickel transport system substrate-binding protein
MIAGGLGEGYFLDDDEWQGMAHAGAEVVDPSADGQNGQRYYGHMYDRLLGTGPNGKLDTGTGALAGWRSSTDARSFTLRLREGMRWHDGGEVTSDDLKLSLEHYARQAAACSACGSILWLAQEIKTIDLYRVEVTLKEPDARFAARLGPEWEDVPLLPAQYLERVGQERFADQPIGNGTWRFVSRVPGESIEFEANTDYWDPARVPGFDRLRLELVADQQDRLDMLTEGTIDMALVVHWPS